MEVEETDVVVEERYVDAFRLERTDRVIPTCANSLIDSWFNCVTAERARSKIDSARSKR